MSRMNTHALDRLNTRLTDGEKLEVISNVKAVIEVVGRSIDVAVYALKLDAHRASNCDSMSNGSNVVAIVRKGVVKTVMLRRDNQPPTRTALRVDKVVKMAWAAWNIRGEPTRFKTRKTLYCEADGLSAILLPLEHKADGI